MDPKIAAKLYCRYVTNNVPFFFLQPLKMEEAYLNPRIEVYHGVLEDDEIETVKKLATPRVNFFYLLSKKKNTFNILFFIFSLSAPLFKITRRVSSSRPTTVFPNQLG